MRTHRYSTQGVSQVHFKCEDHLKIIKTHLKTIILSKSTRWATPYSGFVNFPGGSLAPTDSELPSISFVVYHWTRLNQLSSIQRQTIERQHLKIRQSRQSTFKNYSGLQVA
ncbi:hypothetical protein D9M71_396780 [compost metagenome]